MFYKLIRFGSRKQIIKSSFKTFFFQGPKHDKIRYLSHSNTHDIYKNFIDKFFKIIRWKEDSWEIQKNIGKNIVTIEI